MLSTCAFCEQFLVHQKLSGILKINYTQSAITGNVHATVCLWYISSTMPDAQWCH